VIDALGSVLSFFFQITNSYGLAIILLTVVVRLVLFPLTLKQTRSMQGMARLQPEVKKLQAEHGQDKQKLNAEMMDLYKREKINPAAGCLPLLLQLPVFFGLYQVIRGLTNTGTMSWTQVQVSAPKHLGKSSEMYRAIINDGGKLKSFGLNLAETASSVTGGFGTRLPYLLMVLGIAATGFAQQIRANKLNPATTAQAAQMQQIMKILPVGFALFCFQAQAGLVVYWLASNIWTLVQQEVLNKTNPKPVLADAPAPYVKPAKGMKALAKGTEVTGSAARRSDLKGAVSAVAKTVDAETVATPRPGSRNRPASKAPAAPTKSAKAQTKGASKAPTKQRKGR
jgi:YidC/Oxa1 family membrane protein insertase